MPPRYCPLNTMKLRDNRWIIRCCYLGMFIQATVINLTPLLFIPLKEQMGLTYEQIGRLILINFVTQLIVDIACIGLVDRVRIKPLIVAANVLASAGLCTFALAPSLLANPYDGLVFGTIIFSMGCGLLEVLLSPIINTVPTERKAGDMALLHSFYAIGKVIVILVTALFLFTVGTAHWRGIVLAWAILPALNSFGFAMVEIPPFARESDRQTLRQLIRIPAFLGVVLAIGLAGATEVTISQWTSAFAEKGLGCSKIVGDLVGFCLFGVGLGAGRLWFGFKGESVNLHRLMLIGVSASAAMYLVASLSPWPQLALAACVLAGLTVSLLWPGSLSLATARFPLAGGSMFALMAASGDTGAAVFPWLVGVIADHAPAAGPWISGWFGPGTTAPQVGLRAGLLLTTLCPLAMVALLSWLKSKPYKPHPPITHE